MRWRLEDRLWQVFERLEAKAAKAEARDQEWRRGQELARRAEERALEQARQRYFEQKRVGWLKQPGVPLATGLESTREFIAAARTKGSLTEGGPRVDGLGGGVGACKWSRSTEGWRRVTSPDPRPEDLAAAYDRQGFNRWALDLNGSESTGSSWVREIQAEPRVVRYLCVKYK